MHGGCVGTRVGICVTARSLARSLVLGANGREQAAAPTLGETLQLQIPDNSADGALGLAFVKADAAAAAALPVVSAVKPGSLLSQVLPYSTFNNLERFLEDDHERTGIYRTLCEYLRNTWP